MAHIKIRLQVSKHLHHLIGSGRELHVVGLQIVRNLIRYGLHLRDTSNKNRWNYTNDELVNDLTTGLLAQWCKADPKLASY